MGRLVVPPIRGGGGVGRPHFDSSENQGGEEEGEILAGGAGGDGGVGIGRRGDELELWRIQYYFYQSHCFFLVHLKVEVKTSLLPLSLFVVVILSS